MPRLFRPYEITPGSRIEIVVKAEDGGRARVADLAHHTVGRMVVERAEYGRCRRAGRSGELISVSRCGRRRVGPGPALPG